MLAVRPRQDATSAAKVMQSHLVAHGKINQQLQDLLFGAHLKAHELGESLKKNLNEFTAGSGRLSQSLTKLVDSLQAQLEGGAYLQTGLRR